MPRGQALVELALLLPVLILLTMATLDVGRVFGGYLSLANAAREGAYFAATNPSDSTLQADVTSRISTELNGVVPGSLTVSVSPSVNPTVGSPVTVTVSAAYPLLTGEVLGWHSLTLQATASMMVQ